MSEPHDLNALKTSASALLARLQTLGTVTSTAALTADLLRPRPEDYAKVFDPAIADTVRAAYEGLWATGTAEVRPKPGQTSLLLTFATSDDLAAGNPPAEAFPGGYRHVAAYLTPGRVWARWKFVEPGRTIGMAYDGMVWVDDHWAWFPKPWRAIEVTPHAGPVAEA